MNRYATIGLLTLFSCNIQIISSKYFSELKKIEVPKIVETEDLQEKIEIQTVYYSDTEVEIKGGKLPITVWDLGEKIGKKEIKNLDKFISNLEAYITISEQAIEEDYNTDFGMVVEYIIYHLDNLNRIELIELGIDDEQPLVKKIKILYERLNLKSVNLYPTETLGNYAVFDYTINFPKTDLLLVVKLKMNGDINELVMES